MILLTNNHIWKSYLEISNKILHNICEGRKEREVVSVKCSSCGYTAEESHNFCKKCGKKLREICDCWVKKSNYNCGESSCPGYRLYVLEMHKIKEEGCA